MISAQVSIYPLRQAHLDENVFEAGAPVDDERQRHVIEFAELIRFQSDGLHASSNSSQGTQIVSPVGTSTRATFPSVRSRRHLT